jgi:hypothetical protein
MLIFHLYGEPPLPIPVASNLPVDVGDQPSNPGGLGDGSPPAGVQGQSPLVGGVGGEAPRKLKAF